MKTTCAYFLLIIFCFNCAKGVAQNDSVSVADYRAGMNKLFDGLDTNQITTDILINRSLADSSFYNQDGKTDSIIDYATFLFNYNNIQMSKRNYREGNPFLLIDSAAGAKNFTPLGITYFDYERLSDAQFNASNISFTNGSFVKTNANLNVYSKAIYFAAAPMSFKFNGTANFVLDSEFIYTNKNLSGISYIADFGDGTGLHTLSFKQHYSINYADGFTDISIYMVNGVDTIKSTSKIYVKNDNQSESTSGFCNGYLEPDIPVTAISGDVSCGLIHSGVPTGKYAVWLGCGSDKNGSDPNTLADIRKPFIISAGFNPLSGKRLNKCDLSFVEPADYLQFLATTQAISAFTNLPILATAAIDFILTTDFYGGWRGTYYETYNGTYNQFFSTNPGETHGHNNGTGYLDKLREEGYDIVILLYDNGTDYIQNNASIMVSLIKIINANLHQNGSKNELVMGGYSAGAVTTRLALSKMEENFNSSPSTVFPHPHTRLWISNEGEFQGANTPLGFQHFVDYLCSFGAFSPFEILSIMLAKATRKQFDTETSKQLSSSHYSRTFNGNYAHQQGDRTTLVNLQNQLGYPQYCRKVGIAMGNGLGISYPIDLSQNMFHLNVKHTINLFPGITIDFHKEANAYFTPVTSGYAELDNRDIGIKVKFFTTGFNIQFLQHYDQRHITINNCEPWDNCPASLFAANRTFNGKGAQFVYEGLLNLTPWMMKSTYSHSPSNHSFAPTSSCLDLHYPYPPYSIAPITSSPFNMGLMKAAVDRSNNNLINSPNHDFGYPHINYPIDHYLITPFDAIWAVGLNSKIELDPTDNHFHVEDPQPLMSDFAVGEIAPEHLYLSNRTVNQVLPTYAYYNSAVGANIATTQYQAAFDSRRTIFCGNDIYYIQSFYTNGALVPTKELTSSGDFIVGPNGDVEFTAGEDINLLPGFEAQFGSNYTASISTHPCLNTYELSRTGQVTSIAPTDSDMEAQRIVNQENSKQIDKNHKYFIYPIPANEVISLGGIHATEVLQVIVTDIYGKKIQGIEVSTEKNSINLSQLSDGMYLLRIANKGTFIQSQKIIVQHQ